MCLYVMFVCASICSQEGLDALNGITRGLFFQIRIIVYSPLCHSKPQSHNFSMEYNKLLVDNEWRV